MTQRAPYRACPACGERHYHNFQDLASELNQVIAAGARQRIPGCQWEFSLVVCAGCGFTDVYTRNAAQLAQRVPKASQFEAT